MTSNTMMESPVGDLMLVGTGEGLSGLYMRDHRHQPDVATFGPRLVGADARELFGRALDELGEYFAGERREFTIPLAASGTPFQRQVWAALLAIPYGETRSYKYLAEAIGNPKAVRAVGLANGRNPISIIVPCHRVIGSNGSLIGYGGGLPTKRFLLAMETAQSVPNLF